jgi:hypothetical protein
MKQVILLAVLCVLCATFTKGAQYNCEGKTICYMDPKYSNESECLSLRATRVRKETYTTELNRKTVAAKDNNSSMKNFNCDELKMICNNQVIIFKEEEGENYMKTSIHDISEVDNLFLVFDRNNTALYYSCEKLNDIESETLNNSAVENMTDVAEIPTVINSSNVVYNSSKNSTLNNSAVENMTDVTAIPTVINSSNVVYNSSKNSTLNNSAVENMTDVSYDIDIENMKEYERTLKQTISPQEKLNTRKNIQEFIDNVKDNELVKNTMTCTMISGVSFWFLVGIYRLGESL